VEFVSARAAGEEVTAELLRSGRLGREKIGEPKRPAVNLSDLATDQSVTVAFASATNATVDEPLLCGENSPEKTTG
jgi:hypothetical protein